MDSEDEEVVSDLSGSETGWSDDEVPIDTGVSCLHVCCFAHHK